MQGAATYKAVQAISPGRLELVEKPLKAPGPGQVRIRVEACGVCHSDSATVEGILPIRGGEGKSQQRVWSSCDDG
jgi:alcohol dehydrogenase, propanol-preferring